MIYPVDSVIQPLNNWGQMDNRGVLGASFRLSAIPIWRTIPVRYINLYLRIASGKTMLINETSTFLFTLHVKNKCAESKNRFIKQ